MEDHKDLNYTLNIYIAPSTPPMLISNSSIPPNKTTDIGDFRVHISTLVICVIGNVFIMLFSCYGNGKTLVTSCKQGFGMVNNFGRLKLNLCLGDFILSLIQCPTLILSSLGTASDTNFLLPFSFFFVGLSLTVSLNCLSGIALHRFMKVRFNYEILLSEKCVVIYLIIVWIFGFFIASMFSTVITMELNKFQSQVQYTIIEHLALKVVNYTMVSLFLMTFLVLFFSYVTIIKIVLKTSGNNSSTTMTRCFRKCSSKVTVNDQNIQPQGSNAKNKSKHERKAIASCIGILCYHFFCWMPFVSAYIFGDYMEDLYIKLNVKFIAWMLLLSQSAINPYIYSMPKDIRVAIRPLNRNYWDLLNFPQCNLHQPKLQSVGNTSRMHESSENWQSACASSDIFQIKVQENAQGAFRDIGIGPSMTYNPNLLTSTWLSP